MNLSHLQFNRTTGSDLTGREQAFTRIDLLALGFTCVLLAGWLVLTHTGERSRTKACAQNMSALGRAFHGYAADSRDAIPPAAVSLAPLQKSWDTLLARYLKAGASPAADDQVLKSTRYFVCPSDSVFHIATPRSYAMSGNNMQPDNWPPGPDSATGVGLAWNESTVPSLLGSSALPAPGQLPTVKFAILPAPADTILLAELIDSENQLGSPRQASLLGSASQRLPLRDGGAHFHHGRFNYLMADGHLEPLTPLETGSMDDTAGLWSIKKGN